MLDLFAAIAPEVAHLLPVQIDDLVGAPGRRSFIDEVGIRRLSCLNLLIDAFELFRGKFSCDPTVLERTARYQRLPARGIVPKFVAQEIQVIRLHPLSCHACENLGEGDLSGEPC
jgi:hypothetical protein